jgi:probable rRNA maturation factor
VSIDVVVEDDQSSHPVDVDRWGALARAVLADEGVFGELSLRFVNEEEIAALNLAHLGHVGPTDVLSFPIEDDPRSIVATGGAPLLLGDVVICPAVALRNAPLHESTFDDEIALLVVHGVLHVLGMDHLVDAEAEEMEAREQVLLAAHHRGEPTPQLGTA